VSQPSLIPLCAFFDLFKILAGTGLFAIAWLFGFSKVFGPLGTVLSFFYFFFSEGPEPILFWGSVCFSLLAEFDILTTGVAGFCFPLRFYGASTRTLIKQTLSRSSSSRPFLGFFPRIVEGWLERQLLLLHRLFDLFSLSCQFAVTLYSLCRQ